MVKKRVDEAELVEGGLGSTAERHAGRRLGHGQDVEVPELPETNRGNVAVQAPLGVDPALEAHGGEALGPPLERGDREMSLDRTPLVVDGQVGERDRPPVLRAEPGVVVEALGADLALEVPRRARAVGPEGGDGGVQDAPADPAQLGQGPVHLVRLEVLEHLERRDELKGAVAVGQTVQRVAEPHIAQGPGRRVLDGEAAHVAAVGLQAELAQRLDQVALGTAHVERAGHPEVAPDQVGGNVGVGGHPVVAAVARAPVALPGGVAPNAEVGGVVALVSVGPRRPSLGDDRAHPSRPVELAGGGRHRPPGWCDGRRQPRQCLAGPDHRRRPRLAHGA